MSSNQDKQGKLKAIPRFGLIHHTMAAALDLVVAIVLTGQLSETGWKIAIALPVLVVGLDVCRFVITENMITRLHLLLASTRAA